MLLVFLAVVLAICWAVFASVSRNKGNPDELVVSGTVEARDVSVGSRTGGRLAVVEVAEGDRVKAGDLLAIFDSPELASQAAELEAGLAEAQAVYDKLANGARFEEIAQARTRLAGAQAQLDLLYAGARQEDVDSARAKLDANNVELDLARKDLLRTQELYGQGVVARDELDRQQARVAGWEKAVAQAQSALDKALAGPRDEEIRAAEAELEYAKQSLQLLLAGSRAEDLARAEANLGSIQARLDILQVSVNEAMVVSPSAGVVLSAAFDPGDIVAPGTGVIRLLLDGTSYIQVFIPQDRLSWVQPGTTAEITVDTWPGQRFSGEVTYLATEGEFTPRNLQTKEKRVDEVFRAKVRIDDPSGRLRPGMVCDVRFRRPGVPADVSQ